MRIKKRGAVKGKSDHKRERKPYTTVFEGAGRERERREAASLVESKGARKGELEKTGTNRCCLERRSNLRHDQNKLTRVT